MSRVLAVNHAGYHVQVWLPEGWINAYTGEDETLPFIAQSVALAETYLQELLAEFPILEFRVYEALS